MLHITINKSKNYKKIASIIKIKITSDLNNLPVIITHDAYN